MRIVLRCILFCAFLFSFSGSLKAEFNVTEFLLNAPPVAEDDEGFTYQDNNTTGDLAENDYDPDGDALTYSLLTGSPNGTFTVNPDGTYLFVPNQYYFGVTSMTYQVCDGSGECDTAELMMYVPFLNDVPQANDDVLMVEIDEGRFGDAKANDYEPDLENMVYSKLVGPFNGSVTFNANGTFFYIPNAGYTGTDMIVYQACDPCLVCDQATIYITVTSANEDPSATPSLNNPVNEDNQLTGNLSSFVTDPENDPLTYSLQSPPSQGSVTINSNGDFVYTPAENFSGSISFNYLACDVFGQCALGTYGINVQPINDAPVAMDDLFSANEDNELTGSVATNDQDIDSAGLTYSLTSVSTNGILQFSSNGSFIYTPNSNWFGTETLTYEVCDNQMLCANASLTINILSNNDVPIAVDDTASGLEDVPVYGSVANDTDIESTTLIYSAANSSTNGTITMLTDGSYTYYPNENWAGIETIFYSVCDPQGACDDGILTITIVYVADQPSVQSEQFSTNEDTPISGDVSLNDDSNGEGALSYTLVNVITNGVITLNANGSFNFIPDTNWSGTITISYLGCNGSNVCDSGILTIVVDAVNDLVAVNNGSANIAEDAVLSDNLSSLASDVEDSNLNYSIITQPQFGSLILGLNGAFTYQPIANYFGLDQFTFSACDSQGSCEQAIFTISVSTSNDSPVAEDGESFTGEDNSFVWLLPEATDADGDELTYSLVTPPMHGSTIVQSNGTYSYTPDYNFHGVDMLTYMVCDEYGACDAAVVVIYVFNINDLPVAIDDNNTISSNTMLYGNVATNDYDTDIEPLTFLTLDEAEFGTFVLNMDGTYTYISNIDYEGLETITYYACDSCGDCGIATLTIAVILVNTPPMLSSNENESTNEDVQILGDLAPLASDAEGGDLIFTVLTTTDHGILTLNSDGSYTYVPDANYYGTDQFQFRVCDTGNLCVDGTVFITVIPIDDIPVAISDNYSLNEDQILNGSVATNDYDLDDDALTYSIVAPPIYGTFTLSPSGSFMYHPASNYNGIDQMTYLVCDPQNACAQATLSFVVVSVNDAPTLADSEIFTDEEVLKTGNFTSNAQDLDNDVLTYSIISEPLHGDLTISPTGNYSYNPDYNFSGMDEFVYQVCDAGGLCDQAIVTVTINFVNDLPIAVPDVYTGVEDQTINGTVGDNDYDLDIEGLVWVVLFGPQHGVATMNLEGQFVYTPNANYFGQDMLTYMTCDSCGACAATSLTFNIASSNDFPIAGDDNFNMLQGESLAGSVATNDSDVDDAILTYTLVTPFNNGSFILNSNGTFNFIPNPDLNGLIELEYEVCDDTEGCVTANITIFIEPEIVVNNPPVAMDDNNVTEQGNSISGSVATNDSDADDDALTYSFTGTFNQGTFVLNSNGSYVFSPNSNLSGVIILPYQVCDIYDDCDNAVLTININAANNSPIAVDDNSSMIQGGVLTGSVATNDSDADNDQLVYTIVDEFTDGTFVMNADGSFEFTPNEDLSGIITLSYQVCDIYDVCDTGILTINISLDNNPPVAMDDNSTMLRGTVHSGDVSSNDTDPENDQLTYTLLGEFSQGIFEMNSDGSYVFTPDIDLVGLFEFTYQVCDTHDACTTAILTITIEETSGTNLPPLVQEINTSICEGSTWVFDLDEVISDPETSNDGLSVQLVSGDSYELNSETHTVTFSAITNPPGFYTVTYEVCDDSDPSLCTQAEITIEVIALNNIYVEEVYVDYVSCYGASDGSIEIISLLGLGNFSFEWEVGGTSNELNDLEVGDYIVHIISDASCSLESTVLFTVSGPSAPLTATIDSFNNIDEGNDGSIVLEITGGTPQYSVQWTGPNGFFSSEMNLVGLNEAGQYTANISDENGCDTQLGLSLVGIEEYEILYSINVSPNPSAGVFKLNITDAANSIINYTMFDSQGRAVLKGNSINASSSFSQVIDASTFSSGVYHLQVMIGDSLETIKLIIQ